MALAYLKQRYTHTLFVDCLSIMTMKYQYWQVNFFFTFNLKYCPLEDDWMTLEKIASLRQNLILQPLTFDSYVYQLNAEKKSIGIPQYNVGYSNGFYVYLLICLTQRWDTKRGQCGWMPRWYQYWSQVPFAFLFARTFSHIWCFIGV